MNRNNYDDEKNEDENNQKREETEKSVENVAKEMSLINDSTSVFKVAIIGMNELGSTTAFLLISRQIVTDVILIDTNVKRLSAEYADLSACSTFVSGVRVQSSDRLSSCEGARIVILCDILDDESEFGKEKQRFSGDDRTVNQMKNIFKAINQYAVQCILMIGVQPFELITKLCFDEKIFPSDRILAPGTMTDTAHFRFLISEKLKISPASVTGLIVGAHGENNFPLWNSITVGGIHLMSEYPSLGTLNDKDHWQQLHSNVNHRQDEIRKRKGSETFSISMALSELVECISHDKREIHPVTVNMKGYLNVSTDLFISLPAVIGRQGVSQLIITNLNHSIDDNDFLKLVEIWQRKENLTHVNIK